MCICIENMKSIKFVFIYFVFNNIVSATLQIEPSNAAFDNKLYEDALDPDLCARHLDYITKNMNLRLKFIDRGLRMPKTITEGNMVDLGSYHACLGTNEETNNAENIVGKYCMLNIPLTQDFKISSLPEISNWPDLPWPNFTDELNLLHQVEDRMETNRILFGGNTRNQNGNGTRINSYVFSLKMAMCLPKSCTTREAMDKLYFNLSSVGFVFEEDYCRLPNDKPWAPADTVATVLLSLIGLLTLLSTGYDIHHSILNKKDSIKANPYLRAFSVYTNTRRLLTFNKVPGTIECIDGIRAFAVAWVILGHAVTSLSVSAISNLLDIAAWVKSASSLWIMAAPLTVDTFFALSGLLVVYTRAGKLTGVGLLKNLHMFYLNRLLRLFPILAFTVLLQISVFHRVADGPDWRTVAKQVNSCRANWWTNFLYIQNYVNSSEKCLPHTWYLTVDTQLHFISPLVLYWVLSGKKQQAWIGLTAGLIVSLIVSIVFIIAQQMPTFNSPEPEEVLRYFKQYYMNILTRSPSFFIGMIYGYILHLGRKRKIVINKSQVTLLWACATAMAATIIYTIYYDRNNSGKNKIVGSLINALMRPAWAMCIGWMILACSHGYGGPINWILSLRELKLISRVSYSMYIIHYPIVFVTAGAAVEPVYFDILYLVFLFIGHFALSFICGLIITVIIDSPASIFIKLLLGRGPKKTIEIKNAGMVATDKNDSNVEKTIL